MLNAWAELRIRNMRMLKVSFGSSKRSTDYNFRLEFLILPSSGRLKPTYDNHLYARAALAWTKKQQQNIHLEMRNLKANRDSETEEQMKENLTIIHEKDRARRGTKNYKRKRKGCQKQKTTRNSAWPLSKD